VPQKKTSYEFGYEYGASGAGSVRPHAPTRIGERSFTYDANGNQAGWTHDQNGTRRTIVWDEENRIQSVFDNGHEKTYKYDDQGQRLIKRGPQGETVYVNQFFTDRPGATGTKHVYAGTTRIASKLMRQDVPNANSNGNTPFEKDLYFYHPDHLGSSSYVTDLNGKLYEALIYFPFGEGWIEENSNVQRTPYLFTAKELDEETGLYYFGARYYDPRTSVWQSADPVLGDYLDGERNNGVYNSLNLGLYTYSLLNPLRVIDPDGRSGEDVLNVLEGYESQAYEAPAAKPVSLADQARAVGNLPVATVEGYANLAALGYAKATGSEFSPVDLGRPFSYSDPEGGRAVETGLGMMATGGGLGLLGKAGGAAKSVPGIKPGSAGGPTAGQRFSESVREAAKAENPTATCVFCRREGTGTQVDHAIPRARGGNATIDNAQLACPHCNPSKGVGDFPKSPPPGYTGPWPPP
jgi:RHS repeat-associated protein